MYAEQGEEPQLPPELEARFVATFNRLCRVFRARGVPREEAADLAQEAIQIVNGESGFAGLIICLEGTRSVQLELPLYSRSATVWVGG